MYITIVYFTDLQDNEHPYEVGDPYPRAGLDPSPERIEELSGSANRRGIPLIKKVEVKDSELPAAEKPAAKKPAAKKTAKKK